MPLRSAISRIPQQWIVSALCSLALAILSLKDICFYILDDIVRRCKGYDKNSTTTCPVLFKDTIWDDTDLPFEVPYVYIKRNVLDYSIGANWIGTSATAVAAGLFSDRGFSKHLLVGSMALLALCYLVVDLAVEDKSIWYIVENFVEGGLVAMMMCSIFTLIRRWIKPSERNLYTAVIVSGIFYGHTLGFVFFKLTYELFRSWEWGEVATGVLELTWVVFAYLFVYHTPVDSPFVHHGSIYRMASQRHSRYTLTVIKILPWSKIVFSGPFVSAILVFCSAHFAVLVNIKYTFVDYQRLVFGLPERIGFTSSIVMIAAVPSSLMGGFIADAMVKQELMSKTAVKKLFVFVGIFIPSMLQAISALVGCRIELFWVLSTVSTYIIGFAIPVVYSTPIDLSPRNAGLLVGVMIGAATLCEVIHDIIRNYLLHDYILPSQLQRMIVVQSVLTCVLATPFLIFGSGEFQHWRRNSNRLSRLFRPSIFPET